MNWPTHDPLIVFPEYGVENGKVDYALCYPASVPRAFVEAKTIGRIREGIEQLFRYSYHAGATILILTDGQKWHVYHPAGEGSYEDRKVTELDFIKQNGEKCAEYLDRYLNYERVKTGKAAQVIAEDYQNIVNQRQIEEGLPEIWSKLVLEKDEYLIHAVMEKSKDEIGHEPTEEQVLTFLKSLESKTRVRRREATNSKERPVTQKLRITMPDGQVIEGDTQKDTFFQVIKELGPQKVMDMDPTLVTQTPPYPGKKRECYYSLHDGFHFYFTSSGARRGAKILEDIALKLGVNLTVQLVPKKSPQ